LGNESFFSAPQLKRRPLDGFATMKDPRITEIQVVLARYLDGVMA
jgi:hypothetical protein